MKVCWISDYPLKGSSFGTVTYELLTRMPQEYSFDALSIGYEGMPLRLSPNIRIFELKNAIQLQYYVNNLKPDVVVVFHSFYLLEQLASELKNCGVRKILYLPCEGENVPVMYHKYILDFDELITPSVFSQRILRKSGFQAKVVPHGVDTSFFTPPKEKKWREFRFGYIGLNDIRKQIPRVMEAYARLKQGILAIAANADGHYNLPQLAKEYGISPVFVGAKLHGLTLNREAVRDFYQTLDTYISPASESFGLPALEAQACGVPVIALEHGASKEVLGNGAVYCTVSDFLESTVGKVGLISIPDLYRKMRFMIQVPEAREKLAKKALENAKKWTWENAVSRMLEILAG